MALAYLDDANPVSAATSVTAPAVAATLAEGDHVFICVDFKRPGSATLATPSGWSKVVDVTVGTGAAGAGTGQLALMVFYAQAGTGGALTLPTLTLGGTVTGSVIQAGTIVYRGDAGATSTLQFAYTSGSDTSTDTSFSVTGAADPGFATNDAAVLFGALTTTTPTFSATPSITIPGCTVGTVNNPWLTSTGTGDDARSFAYRAVVSAGTSTGAPSSTGTLDAASSGGAAIMRLREAVTVVEKTASDSATLTEETPQIKVSKTETFGLTGEVAVVTEIAPTVTEKTGSDSAALTGETSSAAVFVGGVLLPGEDVYWGADTYFGGEDGLDTATLTEASELAITEPKTAVDGGALIEHALVQVVETRSGSDSAALTGETAQVILVTPVGPGTDTATLDEFAELSEVQAPEGVDTGTLSETSALTVMFATDDSATLTETTAIDRPGAVFEDTATLSEVADLTDIPHGGAFYFGGDQYFDEDVYFGAGDGRPVDPGRPDDPGRDPNRDKGFTASKTGEETPADYAVLVALTTTGEIVDELAWSSWNYADSIDWVRPGSMTVRVPLLGKDRLGELNRRTLRDIDNSGATVTLVLTRKGRALWAGPVFSTSWGDDAVDIACASIAKLMDSRMVINPAYLLDPSNEAGTVRLELAPRDRVVRLLQLGMTGERRTLPVQLPGLTGEQGPLVEYLASDLGTVSERVREAVEADGGPDVAIRPELSLDQSRLVWKVQVEEHIGETTSQAAWDYPVSVKALSGESDSSQIVTTGYVLGDTQTSVGSIRGFGVHSIDRGRLQPAMERADRTSVSNKRQEELNALAVSFTEVNSTPARTWSITVHAEADPIIGEEWQLGDYVTISVSDHSWLDDGEYVRRVVGITHNPESIQLETIPISETVDPPDDDEEIPATPGVPTPVPTTPTPTTPTPTTPTPTTPTPTNPTPTTQTLGVFGVATPAGAIKATSDSTAALTIDGSTSFPGGTPGNPKVYDGQGRTCGRVNVTVNDVIVQNYKIVANSQYGAMLDGDRITLQNCDIKGVKPTGDGDLNAVTYWGDDIHVLYNTADNFVAAGVNPAGSHTDFAQTWKSSGHPNGGARTWIIGNRVTGPLNPQRLESIASVHQFLMIEGPNLGGNSGGDGIFPSDLLVLDNLVKGSWNQEIKLDGVRGAKIARNRFEGDSGRVIEVTTASSSVTFYSDNQIGPDYGQVGYAITPGLGPVNPVSTTPTTPVPTTPDPGTPDPVTPTPTGSVPWSQTYRDGSAYQIATGGSGTAQSLTSLASAASGGVYNYTGATVTASTSLDFTGKSNITIRGIKMGQGGILRPKAGTNIVLEIEAPYELTNGGEIVKWVGVYNKVRIHNSLFGPATEGTPPTVKSRFVQFGDATSVGAKYGTVTGSTFRCKAGPGNPVHAVGDTANPTGGVRYTLVTGCLFDRVRPFDENDHEAALMGISSLQLTDSQQIIEFCRFQACASEPEVVSFKMNNSTLRGCTFVDHVGSASLRHGDDGKIHDCWFVSDATAGPTNNRHAAGPRFYGARHEVFRNTIRVKGGANFERPILIDTGDTAPGTTSNGHANVVACNVHHNLVIGGDSPIVVGDNYGTAPTGQIRDNKVVACANAGTTGIQVIGTTSMAGIATSGNQVFATTAAAGLTQGPNGEWKDPTGATGARVPYLTAVMVGRGATYNPWA